MKRPVKKQLRLRREIVRQLDLATVRGGGETYPYDLTDDQAGGCCPPFSSNCPGA
jgi:hypothetical protein